MRQLWIILALLLSACATPTEPPTDTPILPSPTNTPTATTPSDTPAPEPTQTPTPSGLSTVMISADQVSQTTHSRLSDTIVDIRSGLIESGMCEIDCAGTRFTTESGTLEYTVYMIAFEEEADAAELVNSRLNDSMGDGAEEITWPEYELGLDYLPDGSHAVYLDHHWFVFANHGNIFVGVNLINPPFIGYPDSPDDVISLSVICSRLVSDQVEALIEAGY
jgi:hypothetical protein